MTHIADKIPSENYHITIFIIIICIILYISILGGILLYIVYVGNSKQVNTYSYLFTIFVFACIAFTTYSAWNEGDSDIVRYYARFDSFKELPLQLSITNILLNEKDWGFYFMMLLLSLLLPNDPRWFSFIMVFLTSSIYLITFYYYNKSHFTNKTCLLLWTITLFCVVNVPNYTNAYRQYFAFSIFILSTIYNWKNWKAILLAVFSLSCHWSMVMLLIPYYFYNTRLSSSIVTPSLIISLALGILGYSKLFYSLNANTDSYSGGQALGVDKTLMCVQFITITLSFFVFKNINTRQFTNIKQLYSAFLSLIAISYLFAIDSTVITRLSFNWTCLFIIISPVLLYTKTKLIKAQKNSIITSCIILFIFYNLASFSRGIPLSYMIFTTYGLYSPFSEIVHSVNPFS